MALGLGIGIGIDSVGGVSFPPEKSDVLVLVDQASAATLTNKIAGVGDITVGTNLVPNGDCEGDWGFTKYVNQPAILERSSEQKYSGDYSWKVEPSAIQNPQGILTPYYSTKVGDVINYSFKIRRYAGSAPIRWLVYSGNGLLSRGANYTEANSPDNTWVTASGSYTETEAGNLACIAVFMTTTNAAFYVDDFNVTVNGVNTIILPKTTQISDSLITKTTYYSGDEPIPVRIDTIVKNQNDQVFFDSSYKILIYNKSVGAKVIKSIFDWFGGTYSLTDYLTIEKTIIAPVSEKHKAFHRIIFINNRMYVVYRDAAMHTSIEATCNVAYSDDYGITWSSPETLYDASEIIAENPQILIDDPLAVAGAQGGGFLQLDSETMLIFTGAVAGHMMLATDEPADPENVCIRIPHSYYNCFFTVPIVNGVLDLDNKVKTSYTLGGEFGAGFILIHNNVMYQGAYLPEAYLWKSIDNGVNWTKVSTIFLDTNEMTAEFIGERLYVIGRRYAANGVIAYSDDYGATWEEETTILPRLDGLSSIKTSDNKIVVYGRNQTDGNKVVSFYKLTGLTVGDVYNMKPFNSSTEDISYGHIILNNGIYYMTYHDGALSASPNKYDHADAGIYFKAIAASKLDSL